MNTQGTLEAAVKQKIEADTDFQASIANLSDDEKTAKISEKSSEVRESLWKGTSEEVTKHKTAYEGQKTRAEKAEGRLKKKGISLEDDDGEAPAGSGDKELSSADVMVIIQNQVHKDDVAEVRKYATLLGKSIEDTLKDDTVISVLKARAAKRATAEGQNGGEGGSGGGEKLTDAQILENAAKGIYPEAGTEAAERLFKLRRQR